LAVRITGIGFGSTHTQQAGAMRQFLGDVLGLRAVIVDGTDSAFFVFPNGDEFGVAELDPGEPPDRTIGFLVDGIDEAVAELRAAGIVTDEIVENSRWRYVHFTAPDGQLYELAERR